MVLAALASGLHAELVEGLSQLAVSLLRGMGVDRCGFLVLALGNGLGQDGFPI